MEHSEIILQQSLTFEGDGAERVVNWKKTGEQYAKNMAELEAGIAAAEKKVKKDEAKP